MKVYDFFFPIFFADYLLNRLHNIVDNFDTFILNLIVMIDYLKSCVGCGTQYILCFCLFLCLGMFV